MAAAAIGFRAKTGRAIAVALTGSGDEPLLVWRREVSLVDPEVPATGQPYHEAMEVPWPEVAAFVRPFVSAIETATFEMLDALLRDLKPRRCIGIGVVGSPDRSLEKLGNPHIRAHAAEGILFRRVLETAAQGHRIAWRGFTEETVAHIALEELGLSRARLTSRLKHLGTAAGAPWRSDEKAAATAALLMLARAQ